jgi:hypothetical protein
MKPTNHLVSDEGSPDGLAMYCPQVKFGGKYDLIIETNYVSKKLIEIMTNSIFLFKVNNENDMAACKEEQSGGTVD